MDILNIVLIVLMFQSVGETLVNLAFQKPATMSTVYSENTVSYNCGPAAAVDADIGTDFYHDSCSTTAQNDPGPWWMVDLRGQFCIESVTLTNRGDGSAYLRLHHFVIEIFTQNPSQYPFPKVCASHSEPSLGKAEVRNFKCYPPITGRFIRVRKWKLNTNDDLLTLCDIKVYKKKQTGCSDLTTFHRKTGTRMTSQPLKTINNVSAMDCGNRCHRNGNCKALNYNLDLHNCELVLDPRFEAEIESNIAWNYYELDWC